MAGTFPEFMRDVERALGVDSAEYREFARLIEASRNTRWETRNLVCLNSTGTGVVRRKSRIEEILKDHPILVDQFKSYFEQGNQEPIPPQQAEFEQGNQEPIPPQQAEFHKSLEFVFKVKRRFDADHRYRTFLNTLNAYTTGTLGALPMYREMQGLFTGNLDLLDEFTAILPPRIRNSIQ